jgi:hypothetical protein
MRYCISALAGDYDECGEDPAVTSDSAPVVADIDPTSFFVHVMLHLFLPGGFTAAKFAFTNVR